MMGYILGAVIVGFGVVAFLMYLASSSNRRASTATQTIQPQSVSQQSDWEKWGKRVGWGFFGIMLLDIFFRRVFGQLPIEWREWIPSFSWNTFEILAVLVGVGFLWNKRRKKTSGSSSGGSGIVVTDVPYAHNAPFELYGGVKQVKWMSSVGESLWNAFAIPIVIIALIVGVFYLANEMTGLAHLRAWAMTPAKLSMGLMVLLVTNAIIAFLPKSECFPVLILGIFGSILGYVVFQEKWFTFYESANWWFGTTVPGIAVVLPAVMLSCYVVWKSDFTDWRIPGAFAVLLFFAFF